LIPHAPLRLRKLAASVAVAVAVAGTLLAAPSAGATQPTPTPPAPIPYVALGSSFASGYGQTPYEPGLIGSTICGRSLNDYPQQISAALNLSLTDVTCGGATTDNILTTPQRGFIPPQVNAVTSTTRLVTITVGGNDVNYLLDLYRNSCANDPAAIDPSFRPFICTPVDATATQTALTLLRSKLVNVVQAVKARAPKARIILADYLTILPPTDQGCAALPLSSEQIAYSRTVANQLAADTFRTALQTRVEYMPLSLLSRGHDACSANPWVNPWSSTVLVGSQYHPNAAGIAAEADLLRAYLTFTRLK
jgi:lysophospholipase L1-like esterase